MTDQYRGPNTGGGAPSFSYPGSRDFLTPDPSPASSSPDVTTMLSAVVNEQTKILADIRIQLLKQNAPVLTKTIVSNAGPSQTQISDTGQHEVFFQVGGKSVTICKFRFWSTYIQPVYYSFQQMGNPLDGIPLNRGDFISDTLEVRTVYLWVPTLGASNAANINGNADGTDGAIGFYGWTIPDYERGYVGG